MLKDVDHLLCAKIGGCPRAELAAAGISPSDDYAYEFIEPSIAALYARKRDAALEKA